MNVRRLSLKREVLQELADADLVAVGGAAGPATAEANQTAYSCLHYVSCAYLQTCWIPLTLVCVEG